MPLPQLNTSGLDFGNTLLKIKALKQQDEQNALAKESNASMNALRAAEEKRAQSEETRKQQQDALDSVNYIDAIEDDASQEALYKDMSKAMHEKFGLNVTPSEQVFYTDGKWDRKKYAKYAKTMYQSINKQRYAKDGETMDHDIPNPNYNPSKPAGPNNAPMLRVKLVRTGDTWNRDPSIDPQPIIDPFAEGRRQDKQQKETERHNRKSEQIAEDQNAIERGKAKAGKAYKADRVLMRDTQNNSIYAYDKNNPADQAQMVKFGKRLVPINEDPIRSEIRNAMNPGSGAGAESPPEGYTLDPQGRTVGGKPVYISQDGKKAWY